MPASRMIVTHVAHQTAGARRRADQPNFSGLRGEDAPTFSKRARTDAASQEPCDGLLGVGERGFQTFEQLRRAFGFEVVTATAGPHEAAAEAVATYQRGEIEEVAANFAARRRGGQKRRRRWRARPMSPVWLANRSSSSAIARSHCARNGASGPARDSMMVA